MTTAKVFAPATVANLGPGFDMLGLAVEGLGDVVSVTLIDPGNVKISSISGRDADLVPKDPNKNIAVTAALACLQSLGISAGVEISFQRQLPVSGGLGSSAAASVGGALAAALASGVDFQRPQVLQAALMGESQVAGKHLDNLAPCLFGGMTLIQGMNVTNLPLAKEYWIALVTPTARIDTKDARELLPNHLPTSMWTRQMAATVGVTAALILGDDDLLKKSLVDEFAEPARAPLIPGFRQAKAAAIEAGALGVSISGAGPTCFGICSSSAHAHSVMEAMRQSFGQTNCCHIGKVLSKGAHKL